MHTAFLLAAGFGTRLRPLTLLRPKPLLPVCGIPMLDYALAHVRNHGHEKILVNAHYLWEQVAVWADRNGVTLQVELPIVLGTGGGLRAALDDLAESVVIVNADILSDVDLTALEQSMPRGGAKYTHAVTMSPTSFLFALGRVWASTACRSTEPLFLLMKLQLIDYFVLFIPVTLTVTYYSTIPHITYTYTSNHTSL